MNRRIIGLFTIGLLILSVMIMSGCTKEETIVPVPAPAPAPVPASEPAPVPAPVPTPIQTPTLTPDETLPLTKTPTPVIDEGWWTSKWSNDGKMLKIDYVSVAKEGGKPPPGGFFVARDRFFDSSKLERKRLFL
ncbi:hypothetical protein ES703_15866 [subsurface metagenome]